MPNTGVRQSQTLSSTVSARSAHYNEIFSMNQTEVGLAGLSVGSRSSGARGNQNDYISRRPLFTAGFH